MSLTTAIRRLAPARETASTTTPKPIDADLAGNLYMKDWIQREIDAGNAEGFQVGALTTPIVGGGAGTVIDLDQPEVNINVPAGKTIWLIRAHIQCEVPADQDGDVQEIEIGYDNAGVTNASSSTGTVTTPKNLRTDKTSLLLGGSAVVTAGTVNLSANPTVQEIARAQTVTNIVTSGITNKGFELLYEPKHPRPFVGPCAVLAYWGGTQAMSGFAQFEYIVNDTPPAS